MTSFVPIEFLRPGESGRVETIDGDALFVERLEAMGVRRGVLLQLIRGGTPCILAIGNQRLSFRGEEAARILVELVHEAHRVPRNGYPAAGGQP